jgi:phenylalanyl-tRNA synthetase beta chain
MGGEIYTMEIDFNGKKVISPDLSPSEMKIDLKYISKRLGIEIKEKEAKSLLEKMGYGYSKGIVQIPSYRADILHQIDLAEDIAIAYGYENIAEEIPKVATIGSEDKLEIFKRKISEILIGLGLIECKTFYITNKDFQTKLMNIDLEIIELANALNAEYNVLCGWATPLLMEVLKINKHHEYPQNIYTLATTFKKAKSNKSNELQNDIAQTGIIEEEKLSCIICNEEADFTRIKQVLDYLFRMIGVEYQIQPTTHDSFIEGRIGNIIVNGSSVGFIGEISPFVLSNWQIEMPSCAFELNLTELFKNLN